MRKQARIMLKGIVSFIIIITFALIIGELARSYPYGFLIGIGIVISLIAIYFLGHLLEEE